MATISEMWKYLQMTARRASFLLFAVFVKEQDKIIHQHKVKEAPPQLSFACDLNMFKVPIWNLRQRLNIMARKKVLVLDLDETLIHAHQADVLGHSIKPSDSLPDFMFHADIDHHHVRFLVHKRPHVDHFLSVVSQWFELVVFTASMEIYGKAVCDELDSGQGMLRRRYYRQHCTLLPPGDSESYSKDLSKVCADLSRVFIIDNNPEAYTSYPDNAIPIRSWFSDPQDTALLQLLPLLDRLRRVSDVRTILRSPGLSDFSDSDSEE